MSNSVWESLVEETGLLDWSSHPRWLCNQRLILSVTVVSLSYYWMQRLLPLQDVEHTDWQVAQSKDKEHHNQHAGCLASSTYLFDLGTNCAGPHSRRLSGALSSCWALKGLPFPLYDRPTPRNLMSRHVDKQIHDKNYVQAQQWESSFKCQSTHTHLLTPQLVTDLDICQDHQA